MALTSGGNYFKGGTFTVTAYVKNPQGGQKVLLRLPPGLAFDGSEPQEKPIAPEPGKSYTSVSWKVKAKEAGTHNIEADLSTGAAKLLTAKHDVRIGTSSLFDR